jgi:AraC-like DNA-binding protein
MAKAKLFLPPLVFGNSRSKVDLDLNEMQQRVNSITNWVSEYDSLNHEHFFQHRTSIFLADNLRLLAVSSTPTVMKVNAPDCTIAIPMEGDLEVWVNNKHFKISAGKHAMFFPRGKRHSEGQIKSTLLISVDEDRLNQTARTMLADETFVNLDLSTPRALNLQLGSLDFSRIFKQLCILIDQFNGDESLLKNLGINESVYRILVMMFKTESFIEQDENSKNKIVGTNKINMICDYIHDNLNSLITITTLENLSGLSARTLQYEFLKHFDCTPMQWAREQRLVAANQLLSNATPATKIGAVAAMCGFSNLGHFSTCYGKRYQESPSQTLAKALKGR